MSSSHFKPETGFTWERVIATLLAITWVLSAHHIAGLNCSVRAFVFFTILLALIFWPDLFAQLASQDRTHPVNFTSATGVRFLAWTLFLGVPMVWFVFSWM